MHNYRPQRSWGKVMFLQASVILLTGGVPDQVHPPGPGTPLGPGTQPLAPGTPPWHQVHLPDQVTPSLQCQVHPPRPGTPPDQVPPTRTRYTPRPGAPPPGPGTPPPPGTPPRTRYSPPWTRYTPLDQVPPRPGTPPRRRAYWEIRSMRGRYASYWNAILFTYKFKLL